METSIGHLAKSIVHIAAKEEGDWLKHRLEELCALQKQGVKKERIAALLKAIIRAAADRRMSVDDRRKLLLQPCVLSFVSDSYEQSMNIALASMPPNESIKLALQYLGGR